MLAFPSMLIKPAKAAGMKVPDLSASEDWDENEFPHFTVFCAVQLCRPMKMDGEHWRNAYIIAAVPDDLIESVTLQDLLSRGLEYQT